jgi:hypothetical protein
MANMLNNRDLSRQGHFWRVSKNARAFPVRDGLVVLRVTSPLTSVTIEVPPDGFRPLPAGQLIVNVPLKFSALSLARPDITT